MAIVVFMLYRFLGYTLDPPPTQEFQCQIKVSFGIPYTKCNNPGGDWNPGKGGTTQWPWPQVSDLTNIPRLEACNKKLAFSLNPHFSIGKSIR